MNRVAELEPLASSVSQLDAELAELRSQLRLARASQQEHEKEVQGLRQQVEDTEARNSGILSAAEHREATLMVCVARDGGAGFLSGTELRLRLAPQAQLSQAEARLRSEAEEKEAALRRAAELEARNSELMELEVEAAELTGQLQFATSSRQAQQREIQDLRQRIAGLEASSSELVASGVMAGEREAQLQVGADVHTSRWFAPRGPHHPLGLPLFPQAKLSGLEQELQKLEEERKAAVLRAEETERTNEALRGQEAALQVETPAGSNSEGLARSLADALMCGRPKFRGWSPSAAGRRRRAELRLAALQSWSP